MDSKEIAKRFDLTAERFWGHVETSPDTAKCWEWQLSVTSVGYGQYRAFGRQWSAHRLAWFLTYGELPRLHVLHSCDNRKCCNPKHLREGSHAENMAEKKARGRAKSGSPIKFPTDTVKTLRRRALAGESYLVLCREYGVSRSQFYRIKSGEQRKVR